MGNWRNWERSRFAFYSQEFESPILHQSFIADLAHLVEQAPCKRQVVGSSPAIGTRLSQSMEVVIRLVS